MGVRPHVVIVGAGFAGLAAARDLAKAPVDVTIVDQQNYTTFQPLLYQVATAGLNAADVAHPIRGLFHRQRNVTFRRGRVTGVDWGRRTVAVDRLDAGQQQEHIAFDHLVLAAGAVTTWFGITGAAEHAFPLYTLEDAEIVRNHMIERFEAADVDPSLVAKGALTFVVVGGGPTGVETAGALAELFATVFRNDYPRLDMTRARVVLVEMRDAPLGGFAPSSQRHAMATLEARGVELRFGEAVDQVTADHVRFASGDVLPTETVVWAAGVRAHPLAEALGLDTARQGRVVVGPDLAVPGHGGVWAIGDLAAAPGGSGDPLPQLAPVAMQSGAHVARQITRLLEGKGTQPFHFVDRGTMATIGRRSAVAELPFGIKLHGTIAWLAWLGLHLLYLAGVRNRASVLLNWAWSYLTWDRGPRIIFGADERPGRRERPGGVENPAA
ncbi:MAG TPA: NAD(P)/FAD-dependent oxidoreductase [Acidimicrobiales bacterium]|nr:NAD(P)/FAD-dependent oxidoreductase [Acidimicrobiales bacterium]